jgi:Carbohydrate-selective porin, OprB family
LVTSRFLFNIGKTSSVLLAATFFVSGFSASQAEAAVNADTNGVQGATSPSEQLIARKPRKKAVKKGRRTVIRKKTTTIVTPGATTVIKESTIVTPAQPTESAPPPPRVEPSAPTQPQSQVERDEPVSQQDLDRLRGLVDSYRTELEGVDGRIKEANAKSAKGSFSTTTKLNGEVIIGVSGFGGSNIPGQVEKGTILSNRVRLNFDTSFTGKDRLRTRLESANTPNFNTPTGTNMTRLGFDGANTTSSSNTTGVSYLQYSFPLNAQTKVMAEAVGTRFNENMNTFNPLLASSSGGSISRFGRFNPIYRLAANGTGLTVNHKLSDSFDLSVGYAASGINTASTLPTAAAQGAGLFSGSNAAIAQLAFKPSEDLSLGVAYARSYSTNGQGLAGSTGSSGAAGRPTGFTSGIGADSPFNGTPTTANHYSVLASYKLGTSAVLSGWYGITDATREATGGGSASTSNWAATLALPDFGSKGNTLGFVVGQQPKLNSLTNANGVAGTADKDTSLHLEALYKMKLSDNVDVTPGLLLITNPENNAANPTEYVGTIRTTFKF